MTELAHEKRKVKLCMGQLPGLNTPQFDWNLNKMPKHPMPVPPIFQPELAVKGVVHRVEHPTGTSGLGRGSAGPSILNPGTGGSPRRVQDARVRLRLAC